MSQTGQVFVNREKVDVEDGPAVRQKLQRVYDRQCMQLKACDGLSFVRILQASLVVLQVVYNTFTDCTVRHQLSADCLARVDKVLNDRLLAPTVDLICRVGKAQLRAECGKTMSHFESEVGTSWYDRLESNALIIKSTNV